jgi:hypothetical protein
LHWWKHRSVRNEELRYLIYYITQHMRTVGLQQSASQLNLYGRMLIWTLRHQEHWTCAFILKHSVRATQGRVPELVLKSSYFYKCWESFLKYPMMAFFPLFVIHHPHIIHDVFYSHTALKWTSRIWTLHDSSHDTNYTAPKSSASCSTRKSRASCERRCKTIKWNIALNCCVMDESGFLYWCEWSPLALRVWRDLLVTKLSPQLPFPFPISACHKAQSR